MSDDPKLEGTAYSRTLKRAADRLGGVGALAAKLGVAVRDLEAWIAGNSRPPQAIFLGALDIVAGFEQRASRAQHIANFRQHAADRAQAAADRAQARADRLRAYAERLRASASQPNDEQLRKMSSDERKQASNQPAEKLKKESD